MPTQLNQNTTDLQSILDAVNALPEAGSFDVDVTLNDDETQSLLITDEKGEVDIDTEKNISSVTYNGVEVPLGAGAPKIFGDGSDGVGLFTSNTTWLADTEDTGMIVKNFESLTISEGVTVSAGNRNCGMIVRVKGDCTIAGSLVNKLAPKTILDSDGVDFTAVYPASMLNGKAGDGGNGGNGGVANYGAGAVSTGGHGMTGRIYGGGWSGGAGGGCASNYYGGNGGSVADVTTATPRIFIGGAGGASSRGTAGTNGGGGGGTYGAGTGDNGGAGGTGAGAKGNDGVYGSGSSYPGCGGGGAGNYGGGVIILLVGGKLTITGTIDCSGGNGGAGGNGFCGAGGGGGGGGGRIFICHKGAIANTGILNVNGGNGGAIGSSYYSIKTASTAGTAGGIGTTAVKTYKQYMEEDVA